MAWRSFLEIERESNPMVSWRWPLHCFAAVVCLPLSLASQRRMSTRARKHRFLLSSCSSYSALSGFLSSIQIQSNPRLSPPLSLPRRRRLTAFRHAIQAQIQTEKTVVCLFHADYLFCGADGVGGWMDTWKQ